MEMDLTQLLIGMIGGGGVTTIATTIINKALNKGQKMTDNDTHLQTLSEIMTETIKNVQEINKETISNLKSELAQAQELTKPLIQGKTNLLSLSNKGREYQEVLEAKNKHKNKIIQKARKMRPIARETLRGLCSA